MQQDVNLYGLDDMLGKKWYHKTTNDSFVLRDVMIDGEGNYVFVTSDGRQLNDKMLDNYIQSDQPLNLKDMNASKIYASSQSQYSDKKIYESNNTLSDDDILNMPFGSTTALPQSAPYQDYADTQSAPVNTDYMIIDKALKKAALPKIKFHYNWEDYPEAVINMLVDVMDINKDDILQYFVDKAFDKAFIEELKNEYKDFLNAKIICVSDK